MDVKIRKTNHTKPTIKYAKEMPREYYEVVRGCSHEEESIRPAIA